METEKKKIHQWAPIVLSFIGLTFFIMGIALLCTVNDLYIQEYTVNYTNCTSEDDLAKNLTCPEFMQKFHKECICFVNFVLPENLIGNVTMYYELNGYDQSRSDYVKSRDNKQLSGILSLIPSENCEPYRYDITPEEKKPIAPCGAIADAMFNDTIHILANRQYFPLIYTDLMPANDKSAFHNPPGDLSVALQNFTKPKNWPKSIWEMDISGFEYEPFIGWMHTEWKRKPAWRINQTDENFQFLSDGIPKGNYTLRIGYNYPVSRYDGPREALLLAKHVVFNKTKQIFGIITLIFALICFFVAGGIFYLQKRQSKL